MNWHRLFHGWTACWHRIGWTEWDPYRPAHGQFSPGGRRQEFIRYTKEKCCYCGRGRVNTNSFKTEVQTRKIDP